jgi:threonine/homoserine/homoserine lactone efflux protein
MSAELLIAFALFAFAASITPGPNNLMLLASGVNHGFRATLPHLFGVCFGFVVLLLAVGLGLAELFARWPLLDGLLRVAGSAYLLWLAWRIAGSGSPQAGSSTSTPMGFWAAAGFQWLNPKAWMMAVAAYTAYLPARSFWAVLAVALLFALINLPCLSTWTLLGSRLRGWMAVGQRQRVFNLSMGGLLVLSLWPILR